MGNVVGEKRWEDTIHCVETYDPVQGGYSGISNIARMQLANRTMYLKDLMDSHIENTAAHGATSAVVADRIVSRDASGRAKIAAPRSYDDIANRRFVLDQVSDRLRASLSFLDIDNPAKARANLSVYSRDEHSQRSAHKLKRANNLSDLTHVPTARNNLEVYSKSQAQTYLDGRANRVHTHTHTDLSVYYYVRASEYRIGNTVVIDSQGHVDWDRLYKIPSNVRDEINTNCGH